MYRKVAHKNLIDSSPLFRVKKLKIYHPEATMKKISLRMLMFVQAIVAFCIPAYYHLMVVYKLNSNAPV